MPKTVLPQMALGSIDDLLGRSRVPALYQLKHVKPVEARKEGGDSSDTPNWS
jgi:hypothetical protein